MLGPQAINAVKNEEEEGTPSMKREVLGFDIDLSGIRKGGPIAATISIPEIKVKKLLNLLSPEFLERIAYRDLGVKEHERL